jgi:LppP/LprE lipoprotein
VRRVRHDRAVSAHAHRLPPRRTGLRLWSMRFLGLLATGALLAVGVATALMVIPDNGSDTALLNGAPAANPKPAKARAHKHHAKHHRPKLTAAQRRERSAAVAVLRDQGYRPVRLADYRPAIALRVLIGRGEGGQRAFFFNGATFVGNDASDDSGRIRLLRSKHGAVTLGYAVYAQGDKACCPHGGTARVRFALKQGSLVSEGAIPPLEARRGAG